MKLLNNHECSKPADRLDEPQVERLGEVLDELLSQAEAGRVPNIEAACQQHPDLADAIRHYVRSMQLLHNAAHAKSASSVDSSRIDLLAPPERQLGDYRLVREIGRGGMGIVYEAQQQSLSRRVALKILPFAAVLDARQITRFQNEAQAAASLHHPHIVPVYAVGHERGTYYYSMQYIDGQTLEFAIDQMRHGRDASLFGLRSDDRAHVQLRNASTLIARGSRSHSSALPADKVPVGDRSANPQATAPHAAGPNAVGPNMAGSRLVEGEVASTVRMNADASTVHSVRNRDYVRRVAEIGIQAAEALHYAHEHGIVHRDVKPSNLMIDASGNLWVTDFGLAQCASSHSLTRSGDVIGTLRYMSPEQATGRSHLIDHRTDVYALGATLYELLTLRPVVDGADRMLMVRQIENDMPPSMRRFNSAIPIDLENILLKALNKSREERYTSAGELAADLKRFLDGQTPLARRPTLLDHSARWVRRHAKAVAATGFALTILLFGALAATLLLQAKNREIHSANARAESHLLRANEAVYQFGHALLHRLEHLPGSEQIRLDTARDTIAYFRAFASYAHDRSLMQADVARALMVCGDLELQIGEPAAAIDHYRQAHQLWSRVAVPERQVLQWLCQNNQANAYAQLGQLDQARELLQTALRSAQLHEGTFAQPTDAVPVAGLERVLANRPIQDLPDQLAIQAVMQLNLGHLLWELRESRGAEGAFAKALELIDQAQAMQQGQSGLRSSDNNRLQQQLNSLMSTALIQSGQLIEGTDQAGQAQALFQRAVTINEQRAQVLPDNVTAIHDLALSRLALGASLFSDNDLAGARRLFQKAIVNLRELNQRQPAVIRFAIDLASGLNNLGQAELEAEAFSAAERNFVESKELLTRHYPSGQDYLIASNLGGVCNNLAIVKEHQGERAVAEQLLNEAIRYQEAALARAPDSTRCQAFLAEHRAQLARLIGQQP